MARLPQSGGDDGEWGDILNNYLLQVHETDGTLKNNTVGTNQLQNDSVTAANIAPGAVTKADVGLSDVNNTADSAKPVSTAQQVALDLKADTSALADKLNTTDLDTQTAVKITTDGTATRGALMASYVSKVNLGSSGSDVTSLIQGAIDALPDGGQIVLHGSGVYIISSPGLVLPGGIELTGSGQATTVIPATISGAITLRASTISPPSELITMATGGNAVRNLSVDGQDVAGTVIKISGYSNRVVGCNVRRGLNYCIHIAPDPGHNGHENNIIESLLTQNSMGINCYLQGNSSGAKDNDDNLILGTVMRGGTEQLVIEHSDANQIQGCHFYAWPNSGATKNVRVRNASYTQFVGTYFDGPANGPMLVVIADGAPLYGTLVTGNSFLTFASNFPDNTYPAIKLDGTINSVNGTVITGNTFAGYSASRRFTVAVQSLGFGAGTQVFIGNAVRNSVAVFSPYPAAANGNTIDGLPVASATRMTDPTYEAFTVDITNDTFRRYRVMGSGQLQWGSGTAATDVTLSRLAANVLGMGVGDHFQVDGTWNGGTLRLGSHYLWVDSTGVLRIKSSAPLSDTDGTVVGSQT